VDTDITQYYYDNLTKIQDVNIAMRNGLGEDVDTEEIQRIETLIKETQVRLDTPPSVLDKDNTYQKMFMELLKTKYLEIQCPHNKNKVWAEGIVVRIDNSNWNVFKFKSANFLNHETALLNDVNFIDIEE
jgi:hypothetical protein